MSGVKNHVQILGGAFKPVRGHFDLGTLINHSAASAGVNGTDIANVNNVGIHLVIDITAISGTTPTLTVTIQAKDPNSGKYYTILASAALNTTGTTVLRVYPGLAASANAAANDVIPAVFRVISAIGGTTPSVTAKISGCLLA